MLRRIDPDDRPRALDAPGLQPLSAGDAVPAVGEGAFEGSLLPRDHPPWSKDALTVSQRARELIARLRPVAIEILTFWDHRIRSAIVGSKRVAVDPSGSYRVE